MKKVAATLGIILSVLVADTHAQIAFNDAADLKSLITDGSPLLPTNSDEVFEILDFYYEPDVENTKKQIYDAFDHASDPDQDPNPFINFSGTVQSGASDFNKLFASRSGSVISTLGGLNVSTIADGTARFLVQRSKEELAITFFSRFIDYFESHPELGVLFPQTRNFITQFSAYEYAGMLNALKTAFRNDINNLPSTIPDLKNLSVSNAGDKPYQAFFESNEGRVMIAVLQIIKPIRNGANEAEVISMLADNPELNNLGSSSEPGFKNLLAIVKVADLISQSFLSDESGGTWVDYNQIRKLIRDERAFRIYLGLIYQQGGDIEFEIPGNSPLSFQGVLDKQSMQLQQLKNFYTSVNQSLQQLNQASMQLRKITDSGNQIAAQDIDSYLTSFVDLHATMIELYPPLAEHRTLIESNLAYVEMGLTLYKDIQQKNYSAAFFDAMQLLDASGLQDILESEIDFDKFQKYGRFISSVAEARDADEVAQAIDAAALPAGSSRIKRETFHSISVNGYLGPFAGVERLRDIGTAEGVDRWAPTLGLSAPVGLALSWGTRKPENRNDDIHGGAVTMFFSLVDVGAVASYRIQDNTEELPEFELKNIVSPGFHLFYGIPDSPFTIGGGIQNGPQLRKVEGSGGESILTSALRVQVSLTVDIPIFNLRTVPWD